MVDVVKLFTFTSIKQTQTQNDMNKLITNAISQFEKLGYVRITIYPNKSVNDCYDIIEKSIESAYEVISHFYESINDDIHIAHANSI